MNFENLISQLEIPYVIYGVLILLLLLQLYYIFMAYGRLARHRVRSLRRDDVHEPVSVIICAHNEYENLSKFLPEILNQAYPTYEVIVVNDCSTDDSKWLLQDLEKQHPHLRVIEIKEHIQLKHSKKFALTLGIKGAQYDKLIMTDADCLPNSPHWLSEIMGAYQDGVEIVLGYSPYMKEKGFLNKLIRFETAHTAMSYLSYALRRDAYMGVGRNLSYHKSLFFAGKGFTSHMHIKSGDDDLFVNQNATKNNVRISIHPDAHMLSVPKNTWSSYYRQKARHAGASKLYKGRHKTMLTTQLITALLFYVWLIVCVVLFPAYWYIALAAYFLRLISQWLVFSNIYRKLGVADLTGWIPVLDIVYYFYICINGLFNRNKTQRKW